jgi:hypothetical protein
MAKSSLSDLARTLRRAKIVPRMNKVAPPAKDLIEFRPHAPSLVNVPEPTPTQDAPKPMYGNALDSWEPRYRPEVQQPPPPREERTPVQKDDHQKVPEIKMVEEGFETRTALRIKNNKLRKTCMSVSMSEEEARLIRAHVASLNSNFSTWARNTLFRAIGKPVPARPKKVV